MNPLVAPLYEAEIRQAEYLCRYEPSINRTLAGLVHFESDRLHDWRQVEGAQARKRASRSRNPGSPANWRAAHGSQNTCPRLKIAVESAPSQATAEWSEQTFQNRVTGHCAIVERLLNTLNTSLLCSVNA